MDIVLSILALGVLALLGGAWLAWRRGGRRQAVLMVILAAVLAANIAIWTLPDAEGAAPASRVGEGPG